MKKYCDKNFNKISYYLQKQKGKMKKGENPEKIKEDIIKEFKEEKSFITKVLQNLLKEQIMILENKIQTFKNKENYNKEDIAKHYNEIEEIQRKINIIYQRSHKHIDNIMLELHELLEEMDKNFNKENYI